MSNDSLVTALTEVRVENSTAVQVGNNNVQNVILASRQPIGWPLQVGNPPLAAVAYQPRRTAAIGLTSGTEQAKKATDPRGPAEPIQIIAGDGGVGKTQLAVAQFEAATSDLRVWLNAPSRVAITAGLAQAAYEVHAVDKIDDSEMAASIFLSWLATTEHSWLVVLDDVADPRDLRGFWPRGTAGRVVVTTRRRDLSAPGAVNLSLGVFAPDESAEYLRQKLAGATSRTDVLDGAKELAAELGQLPLALAQAAAVIHYDASTCTEYRKSFTDRSRQLADVFNQNADEYAKTVASAWSLAIERADQLDPVALACPVLELACVLDPHGIPSALWTMSAALTYVGWASSETGITATQTRRALRNLHQLSIITHDPSRGVTVDVRMHALVQRAVTESMTADRVSMAIVAAADSLLSLWPEIESNQEFAAVLRQNTTALADSPTAALWRGDAHACLFRLGRSLAGSGQVTAAVDYYQALVVECEKRLGEDHPSTLRARTDLASTRGDAGYTSEAMAAHEALLADRLRLATDPDSTEILAARHKAAFWRGQDGDPAGAAELFEQLLKDRLRILGPDHVDTLNTRNNIAAWRGLNGDPAGAVVAFEALLADQTRVLGPEHPDTLDTRHNLALMRAQNGERHRAMTDFTELIVDETRVRGADDPNTLVTRHELASLRGGAVGAVDAGGAVGAVGAGDAEAPMAPMAPMDAGAPVDPGDPSRAITELQAVLHDKLRVLGPNHPGTLTTRGTIAYWRGRGGDPVGAVAEIEPLLADYTRLLGPRHQATVATQAALDYWKAQVPTS